VGWRVNEILLGDCLEVMPTLEAESVDAIVTDPPAGISFMQKAWDGDKGGREQWVAWMAQVMGECLRVLKPGGHALVWALPRTSHWTATAIEDAGFEVRDIIMHVFGSGFPKSLDVSKAIDREAGAKREVVASEVRANRPEGTSYQYNVQDRTSSDNGMFKSGGADVRIQTAPATDAAKQWDGWGTALKPAIEDWWLMRKPLCCGTVAANVQRYGTGALNIDGCRIPTRDGLNGGTYSGGKRNPMPGDNRDARAAGRYGEDGRLTPGEFVRPSGRWPANLLHDGSAEVLSLFPVTQGQGRGPTPANTERGAQTNFLANPWKSGAHHGDSGSAARFFKCCPITDNDRRLVYCAKASRAERDAGLEEFFQPVGGGSGVSVRNAHPT